MARPPLIPKELVDGPFTLAEAVSAGISPRHLRGASWRRLGPKVYMFAGRPERPEDLLNAIHRRLPESAAFSGATAAWAHGLDLPPCSPVEVTIPDGYGPSSLAGASVRRAALPGSEIVIRRGLPVTSASRTIGDIGRRTTLAEAVVITDMALNRHLITLEQLKTSFAGDRRAGIGRLRRVTDLAEPLAESPMETRLRLILVLAGLPRPEAQVRLNDKDGRFLARVDLFYRDAHLVLEYDGGTHRDSFVEDHRRQNRLLMAGYRLLRFTAPDVLGGPATVAQHVRAALLLSPRR